MAKNEKSLAQIRSEHGIVVDKSDKLDKNSGLTLSEKARLTAQGALFNFSDEGAALFRSLLGEDYDDAVADERAQLEKARGKDGSLKYEIGGAIVPALLAALPAGRQGQRRVTGQSGRHQAGGGNGEGQTR